MKAIEHFIKRHYLNLRTLIAYGKLRPSRVRLVACDHHVHVDPNDQCAWKKQVTDPIRGKFPHNIRFWREACARLEPDYALDVGLNYGECTFSADYATKTHIIGIEANQRLLPYIEKSLAEHSQRDQMTIEIALAGDQESEGEKFYIDTEWSGGSSAGGPLRGESTGSYQEVTVPMIRIDDYVLQHVEPETTIETIVFKIDVEGYEARVLEGMEQLTAVTPTMVGLIEFGVELLETAGENVTGYWARLQEQFDIFAFLRNGKLADARNWSLQDLRDNFGYRRLHTDLILLKAPQTSNARDYVMGWLDR